jgi:hypothetical protein
VQQRPTERNEAQRKALDERLLQLQRSGTELPLKSPC